MLLNWDCLEKMDELIEGGGTSWCNYNRSTF